MIHSIARLKLIEYQAGKLNIDPAGLEDAALFIVNTGNIATFGNGLDDELCRSTIVDFLRRKDQWTPITEVLYDMYPSERENNLSPKEAYEIILNDPGFKYNLNRYYFNLPQGNCLDLCANVTLNREAYIDRDFFHFFFAYRVAKVSHERVKDLLSFVLQFHFNENIDDFAGSISILISKHRDMFDEWKFIFLAELIQPDKKYHDSTNHETFTIKTAVKDIKLYLYLTAELSKMPGVFKIDIEGNIMIQNSKLKGKKSLLLGLVDALISKNYFRTDIVWNREARRLLIKETFGVVIEEKSSLFKNANNENIDKFSKLAHALAVLKM
jgi:hypothetical protein